MTVISAFPRLPLLHIPSLRTAQRSIHVFPEKVDILTCFVLLCYVSVVASVTVEEYLRYFENNIRSEKAKNV